MATLRLISLTCKKKTGDAGDNDEVYMNLFTDGLEGRLPGEKTYWEMGDGESQTIERNYDFINQFTVDVKESDGGGDDFIGSFTFTAANTPPPSPLIMTGHESYYELFFSQGA